MYICCRGTCECEVSPPSLDKLSGVPTSRTISGYNGTIADEKDYHIRLFQRALHEGKIIMNAQYIHFLFAGGLTTSLYRAAKKLAGSQQVVVVSCSQKNWRSTRNQSICIRDKTKHIKDISLVLTVHATKIFRTTAITFHLASMMIPPRVYLHSLPCVNANCTRLSGRSK